MFKNTEFKHINTEYNNRWRILVLLSSFFLGMGITKMPRIIYDPSVYSENPFKTTETLNPDENERFPPVEPKDNLSEKLINALAIECDVVTKHLIECLKKIEEGVMCAAGCSAWMTFQNKICKKSLKVSQAIDEFKKNPNNEFLIIGLTRELNAFLYENPNEFDAALTYIRDDKAIQLANHLINEFKDIVNERPGAINIVLWTKIEKIIRDKYSKTRLLMEQVKGDVNNKTILDELEKSLKDNIRFDAVLRHKISQYIHDEELQQIVTKDTREKNTKTIANLPPPTQVLLVAPTER